MGTKWTINTYLTRGARACPPSTEGAPTDASARRSVIAATELPVSRTGDESDAPAGMARDPRRPYGALGRTAPRALFLCLPFVVDDLDDLPSSLVLAAVPSCFTSRTALTDLQCTSGPLRSPFALLQGMWRARLAGHRPHCRRVPIATHRPR